MAFQQLRDTLQYLFQNITQNRQRLRQLSGMPERTFTRNYSLLVSGQDLTRVGGSGRPRILGGDSQRRVVQFARRNPVWSSQHIATAAARNGNILVSSRTIQRCLRAAGYSKFLPKKIPNLTLRHKQLRLQFCKAHKRRRFTNVFITDECMFQLHRNCVRHWCRRNQRPTKPTPKFSPSVMVWGALSVRGFYLKVLPRGTVTSDKYCQTLGEFLPFADNLFPRGWVLQQDGATPHTAASTAQWLSANSVRVLQWPPNSPDLSPIENVWQIIKDHVEKKSPTNIEDLRREIEDSASIVSKSLQVRLMNSLPRRLRVCVERQGDLVG
jgi:hypothetical protein